MEETREERRTRKEKEFVEDTKLLQILTSNNDVNELARLLEVIRHNLDRVASTKLGKGARRAVDNLAINLDSAQKLTDGLGKRFANFIDKQLKKIEL